MKTGTEKLILKTTAFSTQGKNEKRSSQYTCMLAESSGQEKQQTLPGEDRIKKGLKHKGLVLQSCLVVLGHLLAPTCWLPLLINPQNGSKPVSSNGFVFPISLRITGSSNMFRALQIFIIRKKLRTTCCAFNVQLLTAYFLYSQHVSICII